MEPPERRPPVGPRQAPVEHEDIGVLGGHELVDVVEVGVRGDRPQIGELGQLLADRLAQQPMTADDGDPGVCHDASFWDRLHVPIPAAA